jgi:hypothetical protein
MASAPSPDRPYSLLARNVPLAHRRLMRNGDLAGLAGALDIKIVDAKHFYTLVLPGKE